MNYLTNLCKKKWLRNCYAANEGIQAEIESGFVITKKNISKIQNSPSKDNIKNKIWRFW